jgi:hypothetical protein
MTFLFGSADFDILAPCSDSIHEPMAKIVTLPDQFDDARGMACLETWGPFFHSFPVPLLRGGFTTLS